MNVLAVTRQREWSWWVRWVAAWLGLLEGLVAVLSFGFFDLLRLLHDPSAQ